MDFQRTERYVSFPSFHIKTHTQKKLYGQSRIPFRSQEKISKDMRFICRRTR